MSGPFQGGPDRPRVSAVVVSHNTRDELLRCLDALARNVRLPLEVLVIDNASGDGSADAARGAFPRTRVIEVGDNIGFSRANNLGLGEAKAPYLLVLNSDAEVTLGSVETMVGLLETRPDAGIVGPRTLSSDGTLQVSSGPRPTLVSEWRQRRLIRGVRARTPAALEEAARRYAREHEPDWVSASCLLARRETIEALHGFDEAFFLYQEDVDLCVRAGQAGWRVVYTPRAQVVHHLGRSMAGAGSRPRLEYHRSHLLYYRKHNGPLPTLLLRLYLLSLAVGALLIRFGSAERRREAADLLRLALGGP